MTTLLCVAALIVIQPDLSERKSHPLAPSLPLLTKDEYAKIDLVIDRFILADTGKVKGLEAKRALEDFNKLGSEAIFNLIDGLNRAANMESSCPAVIIARKVGGVLNKTDDLALLTFAKDNIGAGVTAKRHTDVLRDLQFNILLRKNTIARRVGAEPGAGGTKVSAMSLADLEKSAKKESGNLLKAILTEAEKRNGQKAADILITGIANSDSAISKLSQGLLSKNLTHQHTNVLKGLLQHELPEVRVTAAQVIGVKKLPYGTELISLLAEDNESVRQAARRALKQLASGADYGPALDAPLADRQTSIDRWREWWSKQK